jgi:acetylglutamate kinase
VKLPAGFSFSGLHAGIKAFRKDLALVYSDTPCAAAGCFTANKAKAAPVRDAERRLPAQGIQAVIINSGHANALTGEAGLEDVRTVAGELGETLGVPASGVLMASTGVIGHRLPVQKIASALRPLVDGLRPEPQLAAEAIMTTDTRPKMASRTLTVGGREVVLHAICKGSGMIHPALATTIAVITTDCAIAPEPLATALRGAMGASFNSLTVDGDMSTNDTIYALANGRAGNAPITGPGPELDAFSAVVADLCQELAKMVAADGEGATRMMEVKVAGAPSTEIARELARAVAGSNLVTAAVFGADPNWGRVLAAVGTTGAAFDPLALDVAINGVQVCRAGAAGDDRAKVDLAPREVRVLVDLHAGDASATVWTNDLTHAYVHENSAYST